MQTCLPAKARALLLLAPLPNALLLRGCSPLARLAPARRLLALARDAPLALLWLLLLLSPGSRRRGEASKLIWPLLLLLWPGSKRRWKGSKLTWSLLPRKLPALALLPGKLPALALLPGKLPALALLPGKLPAHALVLALHLRPLLTGELPAHGRLPWAPLLLGARLLH